MNIYFVLLIGSIFLVSIAQVMFKMIADRNKDVLFNILYDYQFYLALILYLVSVVIWMSALSKIEFSVVIPLNIITVIFGGILGYYLFQENISLLKIISYSLMIIGSALLIFESSK